MPAPVDSADPLAPVVARLHAEGRLRVWSLVITAFGDLVLPRGGEVPAARLRVLLQRVGVEPGALRTAASRLTADGWLQRRREGRRMLYRLSARGVAEFGPAASRIYAPAEAPSGRWRVALGGAPVPCALAIGPLQLLPEGTDPPEDADAVFTAEAFRLSEAMRSGLVSPAHARAVEALAADLAGLEAVGAALVPLDAAAARMLLVHRWRRLVLRHPEIPDGIAPDGWPGRGLRARVGALWRALTPATERWLDSPGEGFGPMPPAKTLQKRF